jgi:hypothetical protein
MTTIKVRPRSGIILAGIPAAGAEVDAALAREWLDAGLVTRVSDHPPKSKPKSKPVAPAKEE